jgi:hypothetical protein
MRILKLDVTDMASRCADSILINGKGRVNCRDPGVLTNMVPDSMKPVLQGMNFTAKGYAVDQHSV